MKRNISDLLDRYPAEDVELGGNTPYSSNRIKEITMKNIHTETKSSKRGFKPAHLLVAAAVAAAFTVSALAAGRLLGGDLFGDVFSRGNDSLTPGQMETIDQLVQTFEGRDGSIPAAVTDNGASITPIAALADENIYYLRLRVETPEGTALPDLDWERDGACYQLFGPETADRLTLEPAQGAYPADTFDYQLDFRSLPDSEPNDNVKEFVVQFTNLSDDGIALNDGISKVLTIRGLWTQSSDKDYTPIFTGTFAFDIGLNFQSQAVELDADGLTWRHELLDYTNTMQAMTLSPLSLSYRVDCAMPENDRIGAQVGALKIVLKDGSVFYSESTEYDEQLARYIQEENITLPLTGEPTGVFENYIVFDQPLDLSQVDYVQYGENKIPVNAG
ncbi:hypothetical protein AALB19_04375 [Oscillospiraceae bacterium 50-58]